MFFPRRSPRGPRTRQLRELSTDLVLVLAPVVAAFALMLGLSWWLTGSALAQFSSVYGNSAVLSVGGRATDPAAAAALVTRQLLGLEPLLPLVVATGLGVAVARRDAAFAAPVALLGGVLAFECITMTAGTTFGFLRYLITAVPLVALSLAVLRPWRTVGMALAVAVLVASGLGTWRVTGSDRAGIQEIAYHRAAAGALAGAGGRATRQPGDLGLTSARTVAAWLDEHTDGTGGVALGDTVFGFAVLAASHHPERFVMPPDRDYQLVVDYPYEHGVRYLLAVPPEGRGLLDAVNRYYPGLYAGCVRGTTLQLAVDGPGDPAQWRVYGLTAPISPATVQRAPDCADAARRLR